MKKLLSIITLLVLLVVLVGCQMNTLDKPAVLSFKREIRVRQKVEEGKIPQTIISNYDVDYLATGKFDKETMTNYFVTIYTNKNGTVVQCKSVGKDAEFFTVIEKDIPENILSTMFTMDFDKTWEMMKNKKAPHLD